MPTPLLLPVRNPPLTPPFSGRGEVDDGKGVHPLVVKICE